MPVSFKDFESQATQAGIKGDGKFSQKKQRDFLRRFNPNAATGEVKKTYLHACLTKQIEPEISNDNLKRFLHFEINPLVRAGVVPSEYEIKPSGVMGEFFGASDEESF